MNSFDPVRAQGWYYVATGLWPLVSLRSFYWVTGRKREGWLVQTFGLLVAAVGVVLLPPRTAEARAVQEQLAASTAVVLSAAEVVFVVRRRISPIYLADAAAELLLAALTLRNRRRALNRVDTSP